MYIKTIEIKKEIVCDVAVVGGGCAGAFAAICSSLNGADTLLIEKTSMPGGTITNCNVNYPGLFHAWGRQIISGPCWQAILKTAALGGSVLPDFRYSPENHWENQITVNTFIYTAVIEKMCADAGVRPLYHTTAAFCEETVHGAEICAVGKDGMCIIHAKRIVDCTGDANIVQMLGCGVEKSDSLQPATLINNIAGYNFDDIDPLDVKAKYRNALQSGKISSADFQGCDPIRSLREKRIHMHLPCPNTSSSLQKTALETEARKTLLRLVEFLRTVNGAENLYVSEFAAECGVRESVRIIGKTRMTAEKYISGYMYPDAVAYCFYPIDKHLPDGIKQVFLKESVVPTIPYGALIPEGAGKIIAAGRCAAGDADAASAYRVQAACMAMGQAAGTAAALSVKEKCELPCLNVPKIKDALVNIGAIVPQ